MRTVNSSIGAAIAFYALTACNGKLLVNAGDASGRPDAEFPSEAGDVAAPTLPPPAACNVEPDGGLVTCPDSAPICLTYHEHGPDGGSITYYSCISVSQCANNPTCSCLASAVPNSIGCSPYTVICKITDAGVYVICSSS